MHIFSNTSVSIAQPLPERVLEIEIGQPLSSLSAVDEKSGQRYQRALCLIRLHTQPLGLVALQFTESEMCAEEYAQHIWHKLSTQINEHLQQDGLLPVTGLDMAGISSLTIPRCLEEREEFFANAPFVSVIVSTHDRPERIQTCLRSLLALHYPNYEIIIVDNAPSTSATANFISQTYGDLPQVRYVRENRAGLPWGHNCGMMAARGEIMAFTDDDVVLDANWLIELVRGFSRAEDVACVTGLVLPMELETPAQFWLEEFGGFSKGYVRRIFDMREHRPKMPLYPYRWGVFGTGASMAFRASFLREVGGFDPALGGGGPMPGGEDIAMFFQVVIRGHTLVYEPAAVLYHQHHREYAQLRRQMYHYGMGPTACIMKSVLEHPPRLFDLMLKLPYGLFFILSTRSPKNRKKSPYYPKELTVLELKGMLYGPLAYIQSLWQNRGAKHEATKTLVLVEAPTTLPMAEQGEYS